MFLSELRQIFGDRMLEPEVNKYDQYRHDMVRDPAWHRMPAAVVFPENTDEVSALLQLASRQGVPVTSRGAGSGLAGGAIPAEGGIVCSLERMNRVIEIDPWNLTVTVEPGVVTRELDGMLAQHGLFFAGYPMSEEFCSIGGNVATNAGGGRAIKYGVTGAHVLGLQAVTADGTVLRLGGKRLKDVTGLNVLPLFVGSEGILGVITEITLRLTPRPAARRTLLASFTHAADATASVASLRAARAGVPSSIEYVDGRSARGAAENLRSTLLPDDGPDETGALLLIESEGSDLAAAEAQIDAYARIVGDAGGSILARAEDEASMEAMWKLRKAVPWWVKRRSGPYHSVEDVSVPTAAVAALVQGALDLSGRFRLDVSIFGHAGDGNFHINPMRAEELNEEEWAEELDRFLRALYAITVELGGTISGEHGIGRKRTKYLSIALGAAEIAAMRAVKAALDPQGILNPGVLLPE